MPDAMHANGLAWLEPAGIIPRAISAHFHTKTLLRLLWPNPLAYVTSAV